MMRLISRWNGRAAGRNDRGYRSGYGVALRLRRDLSAGRFFG